ncbi:VanW family protein [Nonomuraea sp. NPDC050022]|uniref:VanW family protein n=1 Tax=Nonomuraea sp. NPDC050022 TaxID=3364358 RepID=UPI0037882B74
MSPRAALAQQAAPKSGRAEKRRRRWILVAVAAVAVMAAAYAVPAIALGGQVPSGTSIGGVDVGGLPEADARARLERELGERATRPMALSVAGKTTRLTPAELGLGFDIPATLEAALDGAGSPAGVVRSLFGEDRELQPRITADESRLTARLAALAKTIDRKPREGGVRYQGLEPQVIPAKSGRALDRDAGARLVREAFLGNRATVALPLRTLPPRISSAEVRRVAGSLATAAVASPLTLVNGDRKAGLTRAQLAAGLRFVSDGQGSLRPSFRSGELLPDLQKQLVPASHQPQDASFEIVKGKPRVLPARPGRGIDAKAFGGAVSAALAAGQREVKVPVAEAQPRLTTEQARKLEVKKKVSTFTTRYPCCAPRVTNIHRIADIVDGHVVMPGETFSLNGLVGKRDKARGFVEAPMILNNRFVNDVGGGVSQFATTMFNAVFFGGFQDVQHMAHQYYITRYPAGRESTVSYPQPDFRWRNDSPYGVLIKTSYTSTSITVDFWSTKRYDVTAQSSARYDVKTAPSLTDSGKDCIPMGGAEGFAIDVWRIFKKDGKEVRRQKFHTVYAAEPRLTCK